MRNMITINEKELLKIAGGNETEKKGTLTPEEQKELERLLSQIHIPFAPVK